MLNNSFSRLSLHLFIPFSYESIWIIIHCIFLFTYYFLCTDILRTERKCKRLSTSMAQFNVHRHPIPTSVWCMVALWLLHLCKYFFLWLIKFQLRYNLILLLFLKIISLRRREEDFTERGNAVFNISRTAPPFW